jgi:hypothetical protein
VVADAVGWIAAPDFGRVASGTVREELNVMNVSSPIQSRFHEVVDFAREFHHSLAAGLVVGSLRRTRSKLRHAPPCR